MADPSQYFVLNSGEVHVVKPENVEEAQRRGLQPATEEQRRAYDLKKQSEAEPLGGVKAFGQALAESAAGLVGIPAAAMATVPSAAELLGDEETAAIAKQKRLELAGQMARYTTVPGIQQELGLRTAEQIEAEAAAHPYARGAGMIAGFFVGPAASKLMKAAAVRAVPVIAAEETLGAGANLTDAVTKAVGLPAKNAAYQAAKAELTAAQASGDAAQIAIKQTALNEATAAAQAAVEDGTRMQMALLAEADAVPAELAPLLTKEVKVAGKAARKSAERMSFDEAQRLLADVPEGQKIVADTIKRLDNLTLTSPAITSKLGTDAAAAIERSALKRLDKAPGFSTRLAEADVAVARAADDVATGAEKVLTAERLKQANESLATIKARKELVAKAIGLGLGRSAEMMMFGMQGAANELALGDPALVAESQYATLGFDGGLGAVAGVAEALGPPTLRAGVRLARAGGNRLKNAIGKVYPEIASFFTGAEPETIRAVLDAKEDLAAKGLRRVIEEATPMPARLLEGEVPAGRLRPLKPEDFDKAASEFKDALQADVRQIAAPKKGGLLYDANNEWRKVHLKNVIDDRVAKQIDEMVNAFYESKAGAPLDVADRALLSRIEAGEFVNTPYRESLRNLIGQVQDARNVAKAYGMTGELVPSAQEAAYKVSKALGDMEARLTAFEAANPTPSQIFEQMKWIEQELFYKKKGRLVSSRDLSLLDRQTNAAYDNLRQEFKKTVLNKDVWGDAAVIDNKWREKLRSYYAGMDNLEAAAPEGLIQLTKDPVTGLNTELVVDTRKLVPILKKINDPKYKTFRDALGQYFSGRQGAVTAIEEVADYVGANVDKADIARRLRETESAYDRAIENAVNEASNVAIKSENKALIKTLKDEYAAADEARRAEINRQLNALTASEKAGNLKAGLKLAAKVAAPVSGTLLGGAIGGPVGAIIGGIGSAAGTATTIALTSPVTVAKTLAKLNKVRVAVSDHIGSVANVLSGTGAATVKTGEALGSFYTRKKLDEEYKRVEKRVRELAVDSDALIEQQDAMLAGLADDAPNVADATRTVNATALQYLASKKPQPPANLAPMQLMTWEPVEAEKRKFLRINEAVTNPLDTLALAAKGALLPEQIDALNTVYPALMAEVRSRLLERIEQTNKIPEKHRMMVSMLLGKDIDGRMQASRIMPTQQVYGSQQPVPEKQKQMPVSRAKTLRVAERSAEYDKAARQNAQINARKGYGP